MRPRRSSPPKSAPATPAGEAESRTGAADSLRAFQTAFFQQMGRGQQFRALFEHLPDVEFFAKDAAGKFVAMSARTLWRVGMQREEEILGLDDFDIHPPAIAEAARLDDREVMRTRRPLIDRIEALFARTRAKEWFLTTKLPIVDESDVVIGIMGFVRPYRGGETGGMLDAQIERVVSHIQAHYKEHLVMVDLAQLAHLSERQLNRRFQKAFRMSAQEFIVRTRIQAASDALLESDRPLAEIAHEHGFYDQSAFTRCFHQQIGETPLVFRRRRTFSPSGR
jgi:AraC-like DNA-binding protein